MGDSALAADGLSLFAIDAFVLKCGGEQALQGKTTREVCEEFVKPMTLLKKTLKKATFCELLQADGSPDVAAATHFVCHAWDDRFLDAVARLRFALHNHPNPFVWLDIFCFNQHDNYQQVNPASFIPELQALVQRVGRVVLVLASWAEPRVLTRTWCLFECMCASTKDSLTGAALVNLDVALSPADLSALLQDVRDRGVLSLRALSDRVSWQRSKCFQQSDEMLLRQAVVTMHHSPASASACVFRQLRTWLVHIVEKSVSSGDWQLQVAQASIHTHLGRFQLADDMGRACLAEVQQKGCGLAAERQCLLALANNLRDWGRYTEAEAKYQEALATRSREPGDDPTFALAVHSAMATCFMYHGLHAEAERCLDTCLRGLRDSGSSIVAYTQTMYRLAEVHRSEGHFPESEQLYRECMQKLLSSLGADHPSTLQAEHNLCLVLQHQGQPLWALQQCLETYGRRRAALGDDHADTLCSLFLLALLYEQTGDYAQARALCMQCYVSRQALLGDEHPSTSSAMHALAHILSTLGMHGEAEDMYRQCLARKATRLGADHPYTLFTSVALGSELAEQSKYEEAHELLHSSLAHLEACVGPGHPYALQCLHGVANLHRRRGQYVEAQRRYTDCRVLCEHTLGREHVDTAAVEVDYGLLLVYMGRYEEAKTAFEDSIARLERRLGTRDHLLVLAPRTHLAAVFLAQGVPAEAERIYQDVLPVYVDKVGDRHPAVLHLMTHLAIVYRQEGKLAEAEHLLLDCLEKKRAHLGEDAASTISTAHNLAILYRDTGRLDEARALLERCLQVRCERLGADHPKTVAVMQSLASLVHIQGRYDEAEALYAQCLERNTSALGEQHPHTLCSLRGLAGAVSAQATARDPDALRLFEDCVRSNERVLGRDHPETLSALRNLANLYLRQGQLEQSERAFLECRELSATRLGASHADTLSLEADYALLLQSQGRLADCEAALLRAHQGLEALLGGVHPQVLAVRHALSAIYREQGRAEDADRVDAEARLGAITEQQDEDK